MVETIGHIGKNLLRKFQNIPGKNEEMILMEDQYLADKDFKLGHILGKQDKNSDSRVRESGSQA